VDINVSKEHAASIFTVGTMRNQYGSILIDCFARRVASEIYGRVRKDEL
jgi:hypothetical protein